MSAPAVHVVSLGCAKNAVDSSSMSELLERRGYRLVDRPAAADVIVVNTCGFIGPARQESEAVLRDMAAAKRPGQQLVAAGCWTERSGSDVVRLVPGIDAVLGTRRWMDIVDVVARMSATGAPRPLFHLPDAPDLGQDPPGVSRSHVAGASAYLKIADGCRRACAFCAIPAIKGPPRSRPMEAVVAEARSLADRGVLELVLVAQDTTDYGTDLGLDDGLAVLLERLAVDVPQAPWIRVLYAYPGCVTDRLIDVMAAHPAVLPYLDMPLQHAHPEVLRRMGRPANMDWVRRTLATMRRRLPGLTLRSTFIVGFPGETEAQFGVLLDFLGEVRFDRVGAFEYSFECGTPAEALGDPVPAAVKKERWGRLMARQQPISLEANRAWVGRELDVLVEGSNGGVAVGRSYRDAPEIDGLVVVTGSPAVGRLARVRVTGALAYDLTAEPAAAAGS